MDKNKIIEIMREIGEISQELDITSYAVGGLVRDFLLGLNSEDLDITSDNINELAQAIVDRGGKIIDKDSDRFLGKIVYFRDLKIDLVAPRRESYTKDSIKPLVKVGTFQDDVLRRDFTINALYYNLDPSKFMEVIDLTGKGVHDLIYRKLDTPDDPEVTFYDDPSRMLRAVRFSAVKNFNISTRVIKAIDKMKTEILRVPFEVIHEEIIKGAISPNYFRIMDNVGILDVLFPELTMNRGVFQLPLFHTEDVMEHILRTTELIQTKNPLLRIASLFHDIGKALVDDGTGHAYNHIGKGLPLVKTILRKYKFSNKEVQYIYNIIRFHHAFHNFTNIYNESDRRRSIRKFVTQHAEDFIQDIYVHTYADIISDNPKREKYLKLLDEHMDIVKEMQMVVIIENSKSKLQIDGYDIMECGFKGKEIGEIKSQLQNLVDEGIIPNIRQNLVIELKRITDAFKV